MKNYKLIINIILSFLFVASIISFSLLIPLITDNLDAYSKVIIMPEFETETDRDLMLEAIKYNAIIKIISIIFSALSAVASAVTLFLLNFKIWKEKKN